MNAKNFWTDGMYSKDWTVNDQIAVEAEFDRQLDAHYEELNYVCFAKSKNWKPKGVWQIYSSNEENVCVRLGVTIPGYTKPEVVEQMVRSGRFDKYCPENHNHFWIEKW